MARRIFRALVWVVAAGVFVTLLTLPFTDPDVREADPDDDPDAEQRADPDEVYDPVRAGEPLPDGWRQLLPRDRIAPIYHPRFVPAEETDWPDDTLVLGVEIDGEPVLFGNQGALWMRAMTWWDHETGSVWSQPVGEAVAGPLEGTRLELLPSTLTEWATWKRMHPQTVALDAAGGRTSFRLEDTLIVVEFGDEAVGYAPRTVAERGALNDVVGDVPVVVFVNPGDPQQWAVFSRQLDDRDVELDVEEGLLVDVAGDAAWDPVSGLPARGTDQSLDPLPAFTSFDSDFRS